MVNIHYILRLWLTEIPPYSEVFVQLMLLQSLIHVLFNPITTIVNATGNIKLYQIGTFIILISNIIFIYIVYVFGCAAYVGITVQCIVTFFQLLFSVFVMQKTTKIRAIPFLKNVVVPVSLIYILCLICACGCNYALESINWHPLLSIIMSVFTTSFICFYIGINKDLRNKILFSLKNKIHI